MPALPRSTGPWAAALLLACSHTLAPAASPAPATSPVVQAAPLVSAQAHQQFFDQLRSLCGQAFEGRVVQDQPKSGRGFEGRLLMHVRRCSEREIQIPFHVGEDHSRTWIISQTGSGLSLKHDHRKADGRSDASTMYGGHTREAGWPQLQSFPADPYSQELFLRQGMAASVGNIWQLMIHTELKSFSYRLLRESREFRVDFDLSQPVPPPPAPWGYSD
jgi:hypothetical protein